VCSPGKQSIVYQKFDPDAQGTPAVAPPGSALSDDNRLQHVAGA
jgi:hypothetical protein